MQTIKEALEFLVPITIISVGYYVIIITIFKVYVFFKGDKQ
jgi:hypothetical protein